MSSRHSSVTNIHVLLHAITPKPAEPNDCILICLEFQRPGVQVTQCWSTDPAIPSSSPLEAPTSVRSAEPFTLPEFTPPNVDSNVKAPAKTSNALCLSLNQFLSSSGVRSISLLITVTLILIFFLNGARWYFRCESD